MKARASRQYAFAVKWIADNDNAGADDGPDQIGGYISVLLVADLFSEQPSTVAQDVFDIRYGLTPRRLIKPLAAGLPWR